MSENPKHRMERIWRDEYLKWICGFANAQGGKIYIGTDDNGNVIGVKDSKKLLEDIPNKVRDILVLSQRQYKATSQRSCFDRVFIV